MIIEYEFDSKQWEETKNLIARVIWLKTEYPLIKEKADKIQKEIDEVQRKVKANE